MAGAYINLLHYVTSKSVPRWPSDCCSVCRIKTASRRQPTIMTQLSRLHPPPQQQIHRLYNSNPNITHRIRVIWYQRKPGQILRVNLLFLAGPEDGGSDAGEATIWEPRLRRNRSSVWAGSRDKKHQFDLGRNPPGNWERELTFSYLVA